MTIFENFLRLKNFFGASRRIRPPLSIHGRIREDNREGPAQLQLLLTGAPYYETNNNNGVGLMPPPSWFGFGSKLTVQVPAIKSKSLHFENYLSSIIIKAIKIAFYSCNTNEFANKMRVLSVHSPDAVIFSKLRPLRYSFDRRKNTWTAFPHLTFPTDPEGLPGLCLHLSPLRKIQGHSKQYVAKDEDIKSFRCEEQKFSRVMKDTQFGRE